MHVCIVSLTIFVDCVFSYSLHIHALINFISVCDNNSQNNSCSIGSNEYYGSDSEWFWLFHGGDDVSGLEILSFYQLTGLNVSESAAESCVFYNDTSNIFEFGDCNDTSSNYSFTCDDDYHVKARERNVRLLVKTNWFNGQKLCMLF